MLVQMRKEKNMVQAADPRKAEPVAVVDASEQAPSKEEAGPPHSIQTRAGKHPVEPKERGKALGVNRPPDEDQIKL